MMHRNYFSCLVGAIFLSASLSGPAAAAGIFAASGFRTPGGGGGGGGGCCGHCHVVNIWKQININKPIWINKSIVINKGGVSVSISGAEASAAAGAETTVYGGGSYAEEMVINRGGEIGNLQTEETCQAQQATVVKAIHAVCVAPTGEEFPASHMLGESWIESSYEGEVARCIPGAVLKVVIGDVVQSDQGMAGTYEHGRVLMCGAHEVLRHFKNGMLKCAAAMPVPDCTERTNLRRFGSGDFFFAYQAEVCATSAREVSSRAASLSGITLEGGVGE
jgi:hypothetical protein